MKILTVDGAFGIEHLTFHERPSPKPGHGQVRLRMLAASLNFRDLLMVQGRYNPRQPLPLIPCSDGVGEIIEVGPGVHALSPGDRVATLFAQGWLGGQPDRRTLKNTLGGPLDGTLAEEMVLDQDGVIPVPAHLTDAEAACLPCAALTAWSALVTEARLKAGDTVLIQGTGGVSIFALQFASLLGLRPIVTSSSDEKLNRVRTLGATDTINYIDNPRWGRAARELTNGRGVDAVIEVGGANTLEQSLKALRIGGYIAMIGVLSGSAAPLDITPILMRQVQLQGILVGSAEGFAAMNRAVALHQLRPVIDRSFPFQFAPDAFRWMAQAKHFGKITITFNRL